MSGFTPEELFYGYTNNKKELVRELITYQTPAEKDLKISFQLYM